jgi:DNA-binding LytR/AlgR family response regulator
MAKLRTFILEDDFIHASKLEMLLDELGYLVVGTADNKDDAQVMIAALKPDLLFIDIMINGREDGISLVENLQSCQTIPVIFITSLRAEETIKRAMKLKPYAYILKPFEKATLQTSIELAVARFINPNESSKSTSSWENDRLNPDHIFIKSAGRLDKIVLNDIHFIEVRDKVCIMVMDTDERKVRIPLSALETKLDSNQFLRVHRSYLINLTYISRIDWLNSIIYLSKNQVPIGRSFREDIKRKLVAHFL